MKKIGSLFLVVLSLNLSAQQLDIDYTPGGNPEKVVKFTLFKTIGGGLNTQGVYELTSEALRVEATNGNGWGAGMSLYSNFTFFGGDLENLKTRASHLLYSYGGLVNGQLTLSGPLITSDHPLLLTVHGGARLNDAGIALPMMQSPRYVNFDAGLGLYRSLKLKQTPKLSLFSWLQPTLTHHWLGEDNSRIFYNHQLQATNWSVGLQTGLEWNQNFRLSLFINQFITEQVLSKLNQPVVRANLVYRFVKRNRKIEWLELDQ
jgi:hypothetical protein